MKSLFTEEHRYSDEATKLDQETRNATLLIFGKYSRLGFSPREISHIMKATIVDFELMEVLGWSK